MGLMRKRGPGGKFMRCRGARLGRRQCRGGESCVGGEEDHAMRYSPVELPYSANNFP